jgi:Leucine-rich repeat (LRR) protein
MQIKFSKFLAEQTKADATILNYTNKDINNLATDLLEFESAKHLILSDNNLTKIPSCLADNEKIEILNIDNNLLKDCGNVLHTMPNLKSLSMKNNKIDKIFTKSQILKGFGKLEVLYLSDNPLTNFEIENLSKFFALKRIYLLNVCLSDKQLKLLGEVAKDHFEIF